MKKVLISIFLMLILISCNKSGMVFDKEKWFESESEFGYIYGNKRYKMTLWLEKNHDFIGKDAEYIIGFFYGVWEGHVNYEIIKSSHVERLMPRIEEKNQLIILIKSKNLNGPINLFPEIHKIRGTHWLEIIFDDDKKVKEIYITNYDLKTEETTKRKFGS